MLRRSVHVLIGLVFWTAASCALWVCVGAGTAHRALGPFGRVWHGDRNPVFPKKPGFSLPLLFSELADYWTGRRELMELRLSSRVTVAVGDPIFVHDGPRTFRQVGEIRSLVRSGETLPSQRGEVIEARALLYPTAPPIGPEAKVTYFTTPDSIVWVVQTLLTPERKAAIVAEISQVAEAHGEEILQSLRPVMEKTVRDAAVVLEQDFIQALQRHSAELELLSARYQREIVEPKLVPLVQQEIWPIVLRNAEPTLNQVSKELWEQMSLWRFSWRFVYDKSPLPDQQMVQKEWKRFVREQGVPILARHTDEFMTVAAATVRDMAANDRVRTVFGRSLSRVASDPEFRRIIREIFDEVVVENRRLFDVFDRQWRDPAARGAFELASDRLEPTIRRVADLVFGTLEDGITPEFARVLRTQILGKDRRWFLLEVGTPGTSPVQRPHALVLPAAVAGEVPQGE